MLQSLFEKIDAIPWGTLDLWMLGLAVVVVVSAELLFRLWGGQKRVAARRAYPMIAQILENSRSLWGINDPRTQLVLVETVVCWRDGNPKAVLADPQRNPVIYQAMEDIHLSSMREM